MSSSSGDSKPSQGLASCLSNVFKLAEVEGLKWVRYVGPNSCSLEAPHADPVLTSYAHLLSEGYACSWRRLSPSTDGISGESKDLWIFYFSVLPDLTGKLSTQLKEEGSGSWEDGMSPESSTMLFRALNSLIERSLLSENENFLPLGKWFARPDTSMGSEGRGCFLCSFSFFIHAHLYICASVDLRAGPALQPLLPTHLHQALASSSGMQVILSPSGLNAIMTGHSYRGSDLGIDELLQEWKLFYPRRFNVDPTPQLPAAVEVVLGGVRLRYPSQFIFVYYSEDAMPTPPPSPLEETTVTSVLQGGWEESNCINPHQQQKMCEDCHCADTNDHTTITSSGRPSRPQRLTSGASDLLQKQDSRASRRFRPYPSASHPTDNATPMREHPTPSSLNLTTPVLTKRRRPGLPEYTTPLPSPAISAIPTSPALNRTISATPSSLPAPTSISHLSLSTSSPSLQQPPSQASPSHRAAAAAIALKVYDSNRVEEMVAAMSQELLGNSSYSSSDCGWWKMLHLPTNTVSLQRYLLPPETSLMGRSSRHPSLAGLSLPSPSSLAMIGSRLSPGPKKSPVRKGVQPFTGQDSPLTPTKRRPSSGKGSRGGRGRTRRPSEIVMPPVMLDGRSEDIGDPMYDSPDIMMGDHAHTIIHEDAMDGTGGLTPPHTQLLPKPRVPDFMTSDFAVKVSSNLGDRIFDSEDEEDSQNGSAMDTNVFTFPGHTDISHDIRQSATLRAAKTDLHHLPSDWSRIYPTPPSVESADDKYDEGKVLVGGTVGGADDICDPRIISESSLIYNLSPLDEEMSIVPGEFAPLVSIPSIRPAPCVYTPSVTTPAAITYRDKGHLSSRPGSSRSVKAEPQKFIFPPPTSIMSRQHMNLPLGSGRASPLSTSFTSHSFSSPYLSQNRLLPTPLDSPYDPITPTPMSARTGLIPVLPEANALYISLALLDSALGASVSDNVSINMSTLQNLMSCSRRMKLDSVSSVSGSVGGPGGPDNDNNPLVFEEEKPLMMIGIADYPSMGFKEDLSAPPPSTGWNDSDLLGLGLTSDADKVSLKLFLNLAQDYCLHLCLTGGQEIDPPPSSIPSSTPVRALPPFPQQQNRETCRLYHTHSVTSAIMCGKQLLACPSRLPPQSRLSTSSLMSKMGGAPSGPVMLDKEDNSAVWILDLLSLPTKFITKKLRELRSVFQTSFHHAPCIKFSTKGPLSLRDLQALTPSQTSVGEECSPLPMQPIVVGSEHEWISVSPLTLPTWDKLLLEPYSPKKNLLYLVVCPKGDDLIKPLRIFFRNLSITYKSCKLGCHIPLDKEVTEAVITSTAAVSNSEAEDVKPPVPVSTSLESICKETLGPLLCRLPSDKDSLLEWSSCQGEATATPSSSSMGPIHTNTSVGVVIYVVTRENGKVGGAQVMRVLKLLSEMLSDKNMTEATKDRVTLQLLAESELMGPQANNSHHLRSVAFSVFSRCRPTLKLLREAQALTGFCPANKRRQPNFNVKLYSPAYILSPDPPLAPNPLLSTVPQSQQSNILFASDEHSLFCAYCVSADQRWLLAVVCDRQAELIDTCIIGIQPTSMDSSSSRLVALQKLWNYLMSIVANNLLKWNIVITRLGKPSSAEIREWPQVIYDDGLMTANQLLKKSDCEACMKTSSCPSLINVIVLSVQPERNIQLFPTNDPCPSISHILVLPPHPNAVAAMTPTAVDNQDGLSWFLDGGGGTDPGASDPSLAGFDDIFSSALGDMDLGEAFQTTQLVTPGTEDVRAPLAVGFLISTTPPGLLPEEFWGHDRPQTMCSMFKTLLHCHLSVKTFPGSPPDVLCSVLLAFDALSWLSINHVTQQRNSPLPIHIFLLSKLYNFLSLVSRSTNSSR